MSLIRGTFVYYLVLLIGMGFLGVYFWLTLTLTTAIPDVMVKLAFFLSGLILMVSTFALATAKTRSGRTTLTILSGLVGGAHAFMDIVLFPDWMVGTLLFFWFVFGLLLACAALAWLPETDFETTAE